MQLGVEGQGCGISPRLLSELAELVSIRLPPSSLVAFPPSGCLSEADRESLTKWTRETVAIALGIEKGH